MLVIELLERLQDEDPEAEVRLMNQPSWTFEYSIRGICNSDDTKDYDDETGEAVSTDRHPSTGITDKPPVVFIVEGSQLSYGSKQAWDAACWRLDPQIERRG